MQLQKSYKGDDRFKLDQSKDFDVDVKEAAKVRKTLPSAMLGALSKREEELLKEDQPKKVITLMILRLILNRKSQSTLNQWSF